MDDLAACVGLPAMIAMFTEILQVYEETMVFPHAESMSLDFLGDGCWILTKVLGNVLEGSSFIDCFFNVQSVIERQMLLIAWY